MSSESQHQGEPWRLPARIGLALFTAIAVFYLWTEHQAHLFGALPWLLLLACPLMHLFMHRGHGHGGHGHHTHRDERVS